MAQKTKATMPGRQCSTENKEQNQHTRPAAGGQSMSTVHFCILGTAPTAQLALNHQYPEISGATILKIVGCVLITRQLGGTALQHTQYFPQWGECEPVEHTLLLRTSLGCVQILPLCSSVLANSNIECRGQRNFAPAVFTHDFVDLTYTKNVGQTPDLAFAQPFGSIPRLRNSALPNSFSQLLVLVFSACASSSNCLRNSAGMRIGSIGDLPPPLGCLSRDIDMYMPIGLWLTQIGIYTNMCESTKTTPRSAGTLPRRLTKPLIGVTVMADKQHTQTHPKFTWLFLATPKSYPDCSPVVLRFDTDTEENARAAFPGWEMVFAAKIRAEAPCRVAFFDYNTRRGWAFDSASDREVVGHD
ncbi:MULTISPECIES: host cell division inhibitor Icd-like protein [unclassified Citrobacter]|uniref:host cell division inhibitor Icd-like protein n=1 Tax=Citrobacter TaxID=544 RepID=UPI00336A9E26